MILELIAMAFKTIWKYSGMIGILAIAFCIEMVIVTNWEQGQISYFTMKSDLCIVSAEQVTDDTELGYKIKIRNEGSEKSRIPSIQLNYDDGYVYLEARGLYSELSEGDDYRYFSTVIPGKTEVIIYYWIDEYSQDEIKDADEISLEFSDMDVMDVTKYHLTSSRKSLTKVSERRKWWVRETYTMIE